MLRRTANSTLLRRIVTVTLIVLGISVGVLGCTHYSNPVPPTEYVVSRTKTIFLGTLLKRTSTRQKADGDTYKVHSLTFRIDQGLKGEKREAYLVEYWDRINNRDSCYEKPPNPKVGEQWVIYDGYDEGNGVLSKVGNPNWLSWHFEPGDRISRGRLEAVRHAVANRASTFFGEVEMGMFDTPPDDERNMRAELLDSSRSTIIKTATIEKGRFSFSNLEAGTYFVRLRSMRQYGLFHPEPIRMEKDRDEKPYFVDFKIQMRPALPEFLNFALATY